MSVVNSSLHLQAVLGMHSPAIAATGHCPRSITPRAGRALELLGHAIDYLIDEYLHENERLSDSDPQVVAIQLLMALNREIYYECPPRITFTDRLRAAFGISLK
jgi:hypothetical protein